MDIDRHQRSRGKQSSIIVAASDSPQKIKGSADYVCDGTADDVQIQAALDEVGAIGGVIQMSAGNYAIAATITIPDNIQLQGMGDSTILRLNDAANVTVITNSEATPATRAGTANENIIIRDFKINGNKYQQTTAADARCGILFSTVNNLLVENVTASDCLTAGIRTEFCNEVTVNKCKVLWCADDNVAINEETYGAIVTNNYIYGSGFDRYLNFDTGVTEIVADDVITGATSGTTATVESVTLESGSWVGNDAAGRIYLTPETQDGWFGSGASFPWTGEIIEVSAATVASGVWSKHYGSPYGIELQDGSTDIVVQANRVENCYSGGISPQSHSGKAACERVAIIGNAIRNCLSNELAVGAGNSILQVDVSIVGNTITNSISSGTNNPLIRINGIDGLTIQGNVIRSVSNKLLITQPSINFENVVIDGNLFDHTAGADNGSTSFELNGTGVNVSITNNQILNAGWRAIYFAAAGTFTDVYINGNNFISPSGYSAMGVRWGNTTYTDCVIGRNNYGLSTKTYDDATTTADVLATGWTNAADI